MGCVENVSIWTIGCLGLEEGRLQGGGMVLLSVAMYVCMLC